MERRLAPHLCLCLLLVAAFVPTTAQGADFDTWYPKAAACLYRMRVGTLPGDDTEVAKFNQTVAKSLRVAGPLPAPVLKPADEVRPKDVRLGDQVMPFGAYNKDAHANRILVARWSVPLDTRVAFLVFVHGNATYVLLNNEPLVPSHRGFWQQPGSLDLKVHSKANPSVITVCYAEPVRSEPRLTILPGNSSKRLVAWFGKRIPSPPDANALGRIRETIYSLSSEGPGHLPLIEEGLKLYIKHCQRTWTAKDLERGRSDVGYTVLRLLRVFPDDERVAFYRFVKKECPSWLLPKYLQREWPHDLLHSLTARRQLDEFKELVTTYRTVLGIDQGDERKKIGYLDQIYRQAAYDLPYTGDYDTASILVKDTLTLMENDPLRKNKKVRQYVGRIRSLRSRLAQLQQNAIQLAADPEAPQHFLEFGRLVERGAKDRRALNSVFTLYRKFGQEMRQDETRLLNLRTSMTQALTESPAFLTALRAVAEDRLQERIQSLLGQADLAALEEMIITFGSLINTTAVHQRLADEYMDRGDYQNALRHALILIHSQDMKTRQMAMAKVIVLEHLMQAGARQTTPLPADLAKTTVSCRGKPTTLAALAKGFPRAIQAQQYQAGPPGTYLGAFAIPVAGRSHQLDPAQRDNPRRDPRQPVTALLENGRLYLGGAGFVSALDRKSHHPLWNATSPPGGQLTQEAKGNKEFPLTVGAGRVLALRPEEDGPGYGIRAYSLAGEELWDTSDHPTSLTWEPVCAPFPAFGTYFTLVYNKALKGQKQIALAQLDATNGHLSHILPINQFGHDHELEALRFGDHFAADDMALYGWTGSGAVFRAHHESLALEWVVALPLRRRVGLADPPGYVQVLGDTLVAYCPGVQEWIGLRKTDGTVLWRFVDRRIRHVHSRGNQTCLVITVDEGASGPSLQRLDPQSGEILWRTSCNGMRPTGEGAVHGETVYVPTQRGIATFALKDGAFLRRLPMGVTPLKLRQQAGLWMVTTDRAVHLLDGRGAFEGNKIRPQPQHPHPVVVADPDPDQILRFDHLALEAELAPPFPGMRTVRRTSKPFHHTVTRDQHVALLRERYRTRGGKPVAPAILWTRTLPNARFQEDTILTYDSSRLRVLNCFQPDAPLFTWMPPTFDSAAPNSSLRIHSAQMSGDRLAVRLENGLILVLDWKTGKSMATFVGCGGYSMRGSRICCEQGKELICYDLSGKVRTLWKTKRQRGVRLYDEYCLTLYYHNRKYMVDVLDAKNGKKLRSVTVDRYYARVFAGRLWWGRTGNMVIKTGKGEPGVMRVGVSTSPPGRLLVKKNELIWIEKDAKPVHLKGPGEWWTKQMTERNYPVPRRIGDRLYVYTSAEGHAFICSLKDGKILQGKRLAVVGWRGAQFGTLLDRSYLVHEGGRMCFISGDQHGLPPHQVTAFPMGSETSRWPREGWPQPVRLDGRSWTPMAGANPAGAFDLWLGADREYLYLRLATRRAFPAGISHHMQLALDWPGQGPTLVHWALQRADQCLGSSSLTPKIESWRTPRGNGQEDYYIKIERDAFELRTNAPLAPRVRLQITESRYGQTAGWYSFGRPPSHTTQVPVGYTQYTQLQSPTDYRLREQLYAKSTAFFPQGHDLARWMQSRRAFKGSADNIRFLEGMVRRLKDSYCVVNVLSALVLERVQAWREKNPDQLETSKPFYDAVQAAIQQTANVAKACGIQDAWQQRGLTAFALEFYPRDDFRDQYISRMYFRTNHRVERGSGYIPLGRQTYVTGPQDRPFVMLALPGLTADDFQCVTGLQIPDRYYEWTILAGALRAFSPKGIKLLVQADDKPTAGVTVRKKGDPHRHVYGKHTFQGVELNYRNDAYRFPPVPLGDVPKTVALSPQNLLLALQNLPSDSRIGFKLIDAYSAATKKTPDKRVDGLKLYSTLLTRTYGRYDVLEGIMGRLWQYYRAQPDATAYTAMEKMKDFMGEHKIARHYRRIIFLNYNNHLYGTDRWQHLGAVPWGDDLTFQPKPEQDDDLLGAAYTVMERITAKPAKEEAEPKTEGGDDDIPALLPAPETVELKPRGQPLHFRWTTKSDPRTATGLYLPGFRRQGLNVVYHAGVIEVPHKTKIYVYFGLRRWSRYPHVVSFWHNQHQLLDKQPITNDSHVTTVPLRLDKGRNELLVRVEFRDEHSLVLGIGDSSGVPIPDVVLTGPPKDAVVTDTQKPAVNTKLPLRFLGPFANAKGKGFDEVYAPERAINFKRPYKTVDGLASWRSAFSGPYGRFSFLPHFKTKQNVVAYAVTYVLSPSKQKAILSIGSDDGIKIWVNKKQVLANNTARGAARRQDNAPITLRAGWNTVLLKITQGGADWGFYLEILDANMQPMPGLTYSDQRPQKKR